MSDAPLLYNSSSVFLWLDTNTSTIIDDFFPNVGLKRTLHNNVPVLGQTFQERYRNTMDIETPTRRFDLEIVVDTSLRRFQAFDFWVKRLRDSEFFWLPSFKNDFKVTSASHDGFMITTVNTENTLSDYSDALGVERHIAVWNDGNISSQPHFKHISSLNNTSIEYLDMFNASGLPTTNAVIMELYYVKFLSDNFKVSSINNNQMSMSFSFVEDQDSTPTS